jgi:hypothetical protein
VRTSGAEERRRLHRTVARMPSAHHMAPSGNRLLGAASSGVEARVGNALAGKRVRLLMERLLRDEMESASGGD